jgi:hypothetical protein
MDPVTFARSCAAQNLHLIKIVQDHDVKIGQRLNEGNRKHSICIMEEIGRLGP